MADHTIRLATSADFDDVMKIGHVYGERDYLWYRYNSFMDDTNATSYVYIIGDEVVGFCSVFLLDDRQTYHVRAGRVKEKYRGQGVYAQLMKHVREAVQHVPGVKGDALVIGSVNFSTMAERLLTTYSEVYRKDIQHFDLKMSDNNTFMMETHPSLQHMSSADMASLFASKVLSANLFPNNRIIVDWVPLRLLESNMKYITGQENLALMTKTKGGNVTLISLGTPIPGPIKMKYVIDFFGTDVTTLRHHIVRQVCYAQSVRSIDTVFQVFSHFEETFINAIGDTMASLGITREDKPFKSLHHLEREYN